MTSEPIAERRREERAAQLAAVAHLDAADPYRQSIEREVREDIERYEKGTTS